MITTYMEKSNDKYRVKLYKQGRFFMLEIKYIVTGTVKVIGGFRVFNDARNHLERLV